MHQFLTAYWFWLAVAIALLAWFYGCLWIASRESERERRFEAQWDLEHEVTDASEEEISDAYPAGKAARAG